MTEKEYRKLISDCECTALQKQRIQELFTSFDDVFSNPVSPLQIKEIKKYGLFISQMATSSSNYCDIALDTSLECEKNVSYYQTIIRNYVLNEVLIKTDIKSYEFSEEDSIVFKFNDGYNVNLHITNQDGIFLINKKMQFIEELNTKYTLFKNVFKLIRFLIDELKVEVIDNYTLLILLGYSLENYKFDNKYENYIMAFSRGLDDFINQKKIELTNEYTSFTNKISPSMKGYQVVNPFDVNDNLTKSINDVKISEVRKVKKRIQKLYDNVTSQNGSSIVTLNINPTKNNDGSISWTYDVVGRNMKNSGGNFEDNNIERTGAALKALFRGLKAIVTSNINNKNITVVTDVKDILKCVEKEPSEAENNSRRKTIVKYIEENKLLVSFKN